VLLERWESVGVLARLWMGGSSNAQTPGPKMGTVTELLFGFCWSPLIPPEVSDHLAFLPRRTLPSAVVNPRLVQSRCLDPLFCLRQAVVLPTSGRCLCLVSSRSVGE
jgi:hypothetical protein